MTMSNDWVERFREALARTIIQHGRVIAKDANFYGWADFPATEHLRDYGDNCPIVKHEVPTEDTWDEFEGTFHEGDTTRHGMQMKITCECGQIKGRYLRYEGNVGEMISDIITNAILLREDKWN